jgi:hypothetical protein
VGVYGKRLHFSCGVGRDVIRVDLFWEQYGLDCRNKGPGHSKWSGWPILLLMLKSSSFEAQLTQPEGPPLPLCPHSIAPHKDKMALGM